MCPVEVVYEFQKKGRWWKVLKWISQTRWNCIRACAILQKYRSLFYKDLLSTTQKRVTDRSDMAVKLNVALS